MNVIMRKAKLVTLLSTLVLDYLAVVVSFVLSYQLRQQVGTDQLVSLADFLGFVFLAGIIYVVFFAVFGFYSVTTRRVLVKELLLLIVATALSSVIVGSLIYFLKYFDYSRLVIGFATVMIILTIWIERVLVNVVEQFFYRRGMGVVRTLIIGGGATVESVVNGLQTNSWMDHQVVGVLLTRSVTESGSLNVLGNYERELLVNLIESKNLHELVLADPKLPEEQVLGIVSICERLGVRFKYVPEMFDVITAVVVTEDLAGMPLIELRPTILAGWSLLLKRIIDAGVALTAVIVLLPLFLMVAIAIRLDSPGPVFFAHRRVGQFGREFDLLKFRSMHMHEKNGVMLHASADQETEKLKELQPNYKLEHDPRITRVGHFIRKTSVDELPQLLNVLRGEMSLVGPRAYVAKELDKQQETYPQTRALVRRLLTVKPGITGLWQVSGRSKIKFTERVSMDAYYATHANILMDLQLLVQTVPVVIQGSGAM